MNERETTDLLSAFNNDEPLHPALEPYVEESDSGMRMIRHPLVFCIPYTHTSVANKMYRYKTEALERAKEEQDWTTYIYLHERPYRLQALTYIMYEFDTDQEFWEALREVWIDSENVWQNLEEWIDLLTDDDRLDREYLMTAEERIALAKMPEKFTIYRGAVPGLNEDGISWTLDRERAKWFSTRLNKPGRVFEKEVRREDVVAYFTSRSEEEIVVIP